MLANVTVDASPAARRRCARHPSIGVSPNYTTLPVSRSPQIVRALQIAAAVVAPQGHAMSLVLRTLVTRRSLVRTITL